MSHNDGVNLSLNPFVLKEAFMQSRKSATARVLFCIAVFCFVAVGSIGAQSRKPASDEDQNVLKALLNEVHLLRLAIERNAANSNRSQILIERLRAQHEIVNNLSRELDSVRREIDELEAANKGTDEMFENVEKRFNAGTMAKEEYLDIKQRVERNRDKENKLREREVFLSSQLTAERGRLEELNQRLDFLEREMGIPQPAETRREQVKKK